MYHPYQIIILFSFFFFFKQTYTSDWELPFWNFPLSLPKTQKKKQTKKILVSHLKCYYSFHHLTALTANDFWLFPKIKSILSWWRFITLEDIQRNVTFKAILKRKKRKRGRKRQGKREKQRQRDWERAVLAE